MPALSAAVDLFHSTAPARPYCSDNPRDGQYRRAQSLALQHRHIQPNTSGKVAWLCFDVDQPDAFSRWEDKNAAPPTLVMVNPANGHAHYAYALLAPVPRTEFARVKPLQYLAAIQEGMRRKIGGDAGYSGGLLKTPGHPAWRTVSNAGAYGLGELAEWCDLPTPEEMRLRAANQDYAGLGRNCTLFEQLRRPAYKEVRKFWRPNGHEAFQEHLRMLAGGLNLGFGQPLPEAEVKAIARSVAKWVWRTFDPATFRMIQSKRGARKGAAKRETLLPQAVEMAARGLTQQLIADSLGVSQKTVSNWIRSHTGE